MLLAKILKLKKFKYFLPDDRDYHSNSDRRRKCQQILNKFLKQKFSDIRVYRFALYDIDYTYELAQAADTD